MHDILSGDKKEAVPLKGVYRHVSWQQNKQSVIWDKEKVTKRKQPSSNIEFLIDHHLSVFPFLCMIR